MYFKRSVLYNQTDLGFLSCLCKFSPARMCGPLPRESVFHSKLAHLPCPVSLTCIRPFGGIITVCFILTNPSLQLLEILQYLIFLSWHSKLVTIFFLSLRPAWAHLCDWRLPLGSFLLIILSLENLPFWGFWPKTSKQRSSGLHSNFKSYLSPADYFHIPNHPQEFLTEICSQITSKIKPDVFSFQTDFHPSFLISQMY